MLATQLPDRARIFGKDGWGVDQELAAATVEILDGVTRGIAQLGGVKRSKLGRPLKIPRPGEITRKNTTEKKTPARSYFEIARRLMGG